MKEHTLVKILVVLAVLVFVFHQVYSAVYKPITTESAVAYTATDGLNITGILIRKEQVITCDSSGVLHFEISDGNRVAKGGTIVSIYNDSQDSVNVTRLAEIESQIKDIEEIQGYNNLQASDLKLAGSKVNEALSNFVFNCSAGNYSNAHSDSAEFLSAMNRKQVITGEEIDFSEKLESLKAQRDKLQNSLSAPIDTIDADESSGYFVSSTDGYEKILSCDDLDRLTPEYLGNIEPEKVSENAIGKIVSDYEWYIAARVSLNDSLKYKQDESLIIRTADKTSEPLPVTVKQINVSEKSDSAVVIFSCQQMNSSLASMRMGAMTVVNKEYSGLKIDKNALRVVDGKTGVYTLSGINIKFVPVEVIYTAEDYVICEQKKVNDDNVLRLYDQVVVKGKNLYDGKVVG